MTKDIQAVVTQLVTEICIKRGLKDKLTSCLLYTSDAADELPCVALGSRRIITKKHQPI